MATIYSVFTEQERHEQAEDTRAGRAEGEALGGKDLVRVQVWAALPGAPDGGIERVRWRVRAVN